MLIEISERRWQEIKTAVAKTSPTEFGRGVLIQFPAPSSQPFILTGTQS